MRIPASAPLAPPRMAPRIAPAPAPIPIFPFSPLIPSLSIACVTVARIGYDRPLMVTRSNATVIEPFRSMCPALFTELTTPRMTDPAGTSTRSFSSLRSRDRFVLPQLHPEIRRLIARIVELALELRGQRGVARSHLRHVARGIVDVVLEPLNISARHIGLSGHGPARAEERHQHEEQESVQSE